MVSSRIATIVGSERTLDAFNFKLRQAKYSGLTRLEVSICQGAMQRYSPSQASVKTLWHQKVQAALDYIAAQVLNSQTILRQTYRKLSVPTLLASFGGLNDNMLVVGRRFSWLINARTQDQSYFVGTRICYGYDPKLSDYRNWKRLEEQV